MNYLELPQNPYVLLSVPKIKSKYPQKTEKIKFRIWRIMDCRKYNQGNST